MEPSPYHCPRCGQRALQRIQENQLRCDRCDFVYFHNTAAAVGAIILDGENILVGIRAREPSKGMLDLPGGFVDPGESLEQALSRELKEELGQTPSRMQYLTSATNTYPYGDVTYTTCDAFFLCDFEDLSALKADDDIEALEWVNLATADLDQCAFSSTRHVFEHLKSRL